MKITKSRLRQIIKEEKSRLISEMEISDAQLARINAEQQGLQSQAEVTRLMGDLHNVIEKLISAMGIDETALELEAIAHDLLGE